MCKVTQEELEKTSYSKVIIVKLHRVNLWNCKKVLKNTTPTKLKVEERTPLCEKPK